MSESETRGKGLGESKTAPSIQGKQYALPVLGPLDDTTQVSSPVLGFSYRNNPTFADHDDQIQVMINYRRLSLQGYVPVSGGPSLITGSSILNVSTEFWAQIYIMLHEMAQKRDGYKSTDATLNTALNIVYRDWLIIASKINIRVIWALYHAQLVNMGLKTTITAMGSSGVTRSRMQRILEAFDTLIYPSEYDKIIDYWSQIYSPYPGGPVIANYFNINELTKGGAVLDAGTAVPTVWAALPDWTSSTDIGKLLTDLEVALAILVRYDLNVANTAADLRNVDSLYAMMGFPTPQTPVKGLINDPQRFKDQFMRYGFLFEDNKGLGDDTWCFWPDVRGDAESLIDVPANGPFDELDDIGAKGIYAWDAGDDDTPGYTAAANKLMGYGLVSPSSWINGSEVVALPNVQLYTREDGWITPPVAYDFTAAQGCQQVMWERPDQWLNPNFWRIIMSEEAEESYHNYFSPEGRSFQRPFDHWGQAFRKWIYSAYKIPYIT